MIETTESESTKYSKKRQKEGITNWKEQFDHRLTEELEGNLVLTSDFIPAAFYYNNWSPKARRLIRFLQCFLITALGLAFVLVIVHGLLGPLGFSGPKAVLDCIDLSGIAISLIVVGGGVWWTLDARFGRQWTYLAQLLNKANEQSCNLTRNYLKINLASDCIGCGLWNHRDFVGLVNLQVKLSVISKNTIDGVSNIEAAKTDWNNGYLSQKRVVCLLKNRLDELYYVRESQVPI